MKNTFGKSQESFHFILYFHSALIVEVRNNCNFYIPREFWMLYIFMTLITFYFAIFNHFVYSVSIWGVHSTKFTNVYSKRLQL